MLPKGFDTVRKGWPMHSPAWIPLRQMPPWKWTGMRVTWQAVGQMVYTSKILVIFKDTHEANLGSTPQVSGWWFGTFFIFPYVGNNHPKYFSEGLKPPTRFYFASFSSQNSGVPPTWPESSACPGWARVTAPHASVTTVLTAMAMAPPGWRCRGARMQFV